MRGESIGARDDDEICIVAGINSGVDFLDHFCAIDNALSGKVSAPLGKFLVLKLNRVGPAAFKNFNGACYIECIAETDIWRPQECVGDARARDIYDLKT